MAHSANQLTVESASGGLTTSTGVYPERSRGDANGNTALINAAGQRTTYSWDIENHITLAQLPGGGRNTMTYDGDGKRRLTDGWKKPIWDGENITLMTNLSDSLWAVYTVAPRGYGEIVARRGGGVTHFYHHDALGSTDRMTDASQNEVIFYLYRAFGQQTILTGSSSNGFTWVGKLGYYRQWQTDDYWVRARVMRPPIGRWLSRDPLSRIVIGFQSKNAYLYSNSRASTLTDPSGLKCKSAWVKCKDLAVRPLHDLHGGPGCSLDAVRNYLRFAHEKVSEWCGRPSYYGAERRTGGKHPASFFGVTALAGLGRTVDFGPDEFAGTICCEECGRCKGLEYANFPLWNQLWGCIRECYAQHEHVHKADCERDRLRPGPERRDSECRAYLALESCLATLAWEYYYRV